MFFDRKPNGSLASLGPACRQTFPAMPNKHRVEQLVADLEARYGIVLGSAQIAEVAGIRSKSALSRWMQISQANGLAAFAMPGRKGRHVLARDLAKWLVARAQLVQLEPAQPAKERPARQLRRGNEFSKAQKRESPKP